MRNVRQHVIGVSICVSLCIMAYATCAGANNLFTKSGVLSNLTEQELGGNKDTATRSSISIALPPMPPEPGCAENDGCTKLWKDENCVLKKGTEYVIKVNFLKVETAAEAVDAYIDYRKKQEGEKESKFWDAVREKLKEAKSRADLVVKDSQGNIVEKVENLGTTTIGKKVKFTANDTKYSVEITCKSGAGAYHLVFEYD